MYEFVSFNFPLHEYFFVLRLSPPPPLDKFSNRLSLTRKLLS